MASIWKSYVIVTFTVILSNHDVLLFSTVLMHMCILLYYWANKMCNVL